MESSASPDSSARPWYHGGLRFQCTQCGNCCTGSPGYVWVDDADLRDMAEHLDKPIGELRLLHTRPAQGRVSLTEYANGDCTFFDPQTRRCRVYPVRPKQCRTWPFWQSNLADPEAWRRTQSTCPGAGQGDFVPVEAIERLAAETDL